MSELNQGDLYVAESNDDRDIETNKKYLSSIVVQGKKENNPVAIVLSGSGLLIPADEVRAYARLFTAAPDMLAILNKIDQWWLKDYPEGPDGQAAIEMFHETTINIWREIQAAIAKAEKGK